MSAAVWLLPLMDAETLREYLIFYQDLGFTSLYRRAVRTENILSAMPMQPERAPILPPVLPSLAPENDSLAKIREDIGECTRCRLHSGRHSIVFGSGNEQARLVFVGEGPGADEDAQGLPFVGRAGQLLTIRPKAICALGATAAKALLGRKEGVTRMRGNWYKWRDIPLMVTYHPSYLMRQYNQDAKREAWEDLKKALHFVYD